MWDMFFRFKACSLKIFVFFICSTRQIIVILQEKSRKWKI